MSVTEERLLSLEDVADRLQVSDQSVRRWIKAGRLAAYKPGLEWRIKPSDLEAFLEARSYHPKADPRLSSEEDAGSGSEVPVDVDHVGAVLAETLRQQREFQLQVLESRLARAETDQERADAYQNFQNWWTAGTGHVLFNLYRQIPQLMDGALEREDAITVERVKEFARSVFTDESERKAELRRLDDVFKVVTYYAPAPNRE